MSKKGIFSQELSQGLGILQGWKAIGRHIQRSSRTARRWHDKYYMPVRINFSGRPWAFISEIETWMYHLDIEIKKDPELQEKRKQHAAMMRARKAEKKNEIYSKQA